MRRLISLAAVSAFALLSAALVGCQSYRITQRNIFSDEDGFLVTIEYGVSESEHVNTFIVPHTGKEMEFKSRLVVDVDLPDGTSFTAWQCMNFQSRGTMYRTDNDRWQILLNGFSCVVYRQDPKNPRAYHPVYHGVLCDTPQIEVEKDDRWKVVPRERKAYTGDRR